jgi:hypothetical protein
MDRKRSEPQAVEGKGHWRSKRKPPAEPGGPCVGRSEKRARQVGGSAAATPHKGVVSQFEQFEFCEFILPPVNGICHTRRPPSVTSIDQPFQEGSLFLVMSRMIFNASSRAAPSSNSSVPSGSSCRWLLWTAKR